MKTPCLAFVLVVSTAVGTYGQVVEGNASTAATHATSLQAKPTPYAVVERGANHRVWERTTYETSSSGQLVPKKHRFTELATGMHFLQNGQWVESKETINLLPTGGAAATNGQMQVFFPSDIYQGVIEIVTSDGKHLRGRPLGISYFDGITNVLIADLTNSVGQILPSGNQVIYTNAFAGVTADLVCTYRKRGFESDLVFRESPPGPEEFGLDPATTRLELLTEFINSPDPDSESARIDPADGLRDQTLTFGTLKMVPGKAFSVEKNGNPQPKQNQIQVFKNWVKSGGRTFLIEEVSYGKILPQFKDLTSAIETETPRIASKGKTHRQPSPERLLPAKRSIWPDVGTMLLASSDPNQKPGVVLDYTTLSTGTNNFTFQGDTTYLISGWLVLSGTTTIEGGAVLKFDDTSYPGIETSQSLICKTASYRPAVFTSMHDDTVGEIISGSTGSPTIQQNSAYLYLDYNSSGYSVSNIRFSYAYIGLGTLSAGTMNVWDCQFLYCQDGIDAEWTHLSLHNVLFGGCIAAMDFYPGGSYLFSAEQITANVVNLWDTNLPAPPALNLTNSIIVGNIRSGPTFNTNSVVINPGGTIFKTVGGASYYLTNNTYRNVGTTNISSALLTDLKTKTTCPPIVISNVTISVSTNFSIQAQRDTDTPDLGFHYDPIDYFFGGVIASANLTFTAGTAVGWFELPDNGGPGYGIALGDDVFATFNGTITSPCTFTRYETVQEGGNGLWKDKGWLAGMVGEGNYYTIHPSHVAATFTRFASLGAGLGPYRDYYGILGVVGTHCKYWSCGLGGYVTQSYYTNCLLDRVNLWQGAADAVPGSAPAMVLRNCTFHGGSLGFAHWESGAPYWYSSIWDCAFDGTVITMDYADSAYTDYAFNAYLQGVNPTSPVGTNNVTVTNTFNWQTGCLGNFYLPTNSLLINTGSVTANFVGLYHFTTQTNQIKETNSVVDIGYHYVAVDAYWNPIDSNGNGIPDYLEDSTGSGQLSIYLIAPSNNTSYAEPATIPIRALVFDWSGAVTNVEFLKGTNHITVLPNSPYQYSWPIVAAGPYSLTAVSRDANGLALTSAPVSITVTNLCGY